MDGWLGGGGELMGGWVMLGPMTFDLAQVCHIENSQALEAQLPVRLLYHGCLITVSSMPRGSCIKHDHTSVTDSRFLQ